MIDPVVKREEVKKKRREEEEEEEEEKEKEKRGWLGFCRSITDTQVYCNKYIRTSIKGVRENQYNTSAVLDCVLGKRCVVLLKPLITISLLIELRC